MKRFNLTERALRINAGRKTVLGSVQPARFLLFCSVMAACLVLMISQASKDGEWTFWVSNFIFLGLLLNYLFFIRLRNDIFEPVILVAGMFLLVFIARGMFLYFDLDPVHINSWVSSNLSLLGRMSLYTVAGFAMFLLAYCSGLGPFLAGRLPRMKTTWNMDMLGTSAIRAYCFCLPAKLLIIFPQGTYAFQDVLMRYLGNIIGLIASLTDVALLLYGVYYYHYRKQGVVRGATPFYIMLIVQLIAGFLTGYREPMFITLLALLLVRHYTWRPLKARIAIIGFLGLILIVTPISRSYRNLVWVERKNPTDAVGSLLQESLSSGKKQHASDNNSPAIFDSKALLNISGRFHGADSLIACMATVPDYMRYQNGETLYLLPITVFAPRAFWPEKPKIGLGTFFRENIWKGPGNESKSGGQIAITQMGELYINFGPWGILIGMLILGVFHRFIYAYLIVGHKHNNYNVLVFYFAAVLCFLAIERNFAFSYGYLIKLFVVLYFLCRYFNRGPVFSKSRQGALRE